MGLSLLMPVGLALMATEWAHTVPPPALLDERTYPGLAGWLMDTDPKTCPVGGAGRDPKTTGFHAANFLRGAVLLGAQHGLGS